MGYIRGSKFYFLITSTSFAFSLIWVELTIWQDQPTDFESLTRDDEGQEIKHEEDNKVYKIPKKIKNILLWTKQDYYPFNLFGEGQTAFTKNKCSTVECYVTADRKFFDGDQTKFDAIAFNGRNMDPSDLPRYRSHHQRYIFINLESADYNRICGKQFDSFFNWTFTYKLDSDIPFPYFMIRNNKSEIVGPRREMKWKEDMAANDQELAVRIQNKTKAAAWFVSNCHARSGRENFVKSLNKALKPYGLSVDVYGKCGKLKCPRTKPSLCNALLNQVYFFYLALENSFSEDYVTEKLLTAMQNDVVPIVYGGADYARFLPPGSYIDGTKQPVKKLAALINKTMYSPKEYVQYFRWKHYYKYYPEVQENIVCALCEAVHNEKLLQKTSIYNEFRKWWNPNYVKRCEEKPKFLKRCKERSRNGTRCKVRRKNVIRG